MVTGDVSIVEISELWVVGTRWLKEAAGVRDLGAFNIQLQETMWT